MNPPPYLSALSVRPTTDEYQRRIKMTVSCQDCANLPKVPEAGKIINAGSWPVQIMHNGVKVAKNGYDGPWMTEIIERLQGHHEPQEEPVFHAIMNALGSAEVMVELGAYWAYYSLWFRHCFPAARSILIEPDSNNLSIGRYNFFLNNRQGEFIQALVGDEGKPPSVFAGESGSMESNLPVVSVDSLIRDHKLSIIDVLLADIQGAELTMLHGLKQTLEEGRLRYLVLSTHDGIISGDYALHHKCLQWIKEHGGHIIAEHTPDESYSGDGLIAVSFGNDRKFTVDIAHNRSDNALFGSSHLRMAEMHEELQKLRLLCSDNSAVLKQDNLRIQGLTSSVSRLLLEEVSGVPVYKKLRGIRRLKRWLKNRKLKKLSLSILHLLRTKELTEIRQVSNLTVEDLKASNNAASSDSTLSWLKAVYSEVENITHKKLNKTTLLCLGTGTGLHLLGALAVRRVRRGIALEEDQTAFSLLWSNARLNGLSEKCDIHHSSSASLSDVLNNSPKEFTREIQLSWWNTAGLNKEQIKGVSTQLTSMSWPLVIRLLPHELAQHSISAWDVEGYINAKGSARITSLGSEKTKNSKSGDKQPWVTASELQSLWNARQSAKKELYLLVVQQ